MLRALVLFSLVASSAFAGSRKSQIKDAIEEVKEAAELVDDEGGACSKKAGGKLDDVIDAFKDLRDDDSKAAFKALKKSIDRANDAVDENCKGKTAGKVEKYLDRAMDKLDKDDDRDRDRDRDRDDERDNRRANVTVTNDSLGVGPFQLQVGTRSEVRTQQNQYGTPPPTPRAAPGMDSASFNGLMTALRGNPNEILRKDTAISSLSRNWITSNQFGDVLDLFNNEILKMDVAKAAASHVVDPGAAVGLSVKFRNSIYQNEFVTLMSSQQR